MTQSYQNMNAQGVFYQMPNGSGRRAPAAPGSPSPLFNPSYDKDKFENTAWTVNGKIGDSESRVHRRYLVRNVEQLQDYTNYARGVYADYYQCYGAIVAGSQGRRRRCRACFSPSTPGRRPSATPTRAMRSGSARPTIGARAASSALSGRNEDLRQHGLDVQDRADVHCTVARAAASAT